MIRLSFRFPLGPRGRGDASHPRYILVSHQTVRPWALKFRQAFADQTRRGSSRAGEERHLDEVALKIAGVTHWLWRAVDRTA